MLPVWLWSVAAHHGEAADPDLLEWIKDRLDHIFNLGPWTVVAILSLVIVLIPMSIIVVYLIQQRGQPNGEPPLSEREDG